MSTRALIAIRKPNGTFVSKYSHYGLYEDYIHQLNNRSYADFEESVMRGDSSEPFDGFYDDESHCRSLGWDHDMYECNLRHILPQDDMTLGDLLDRADMRGVDYVYIKSPDNKLSVFECTGHGIHGFDELVDEEEEDE